MWNWLKINAVAHFVRVVVRVARRRVDVIVLCAAVGIGSPIVKA